MEYSRTNLTLTAFAVMRIIRIYIILDKGNCYMQDMPVRERGPLSSTWVIMNKLNRGSYKPEEFSRLSHLRHIVVAIPPKDPSFWKLNMSNLNSLKRHRLKPLSWSHSVWSCNKSFTKCAHCTGATEGTPVTIAPGMATTLLVLSVKITFLKRTVEIW